MQAVADCLGDRFESARDEIRAYAAVVGAEPSLRARALLRDQYWGEAIAEALRGRGFARRRAAGVAAATLALFRLVLEEWLNDQGRTTLKTRFRRALADLAAEIR